MNFLHDPNKYAVFMLVLLIPWLILQIRELMQLIQLKDKRDHLFELISTGITVMIQLALICLCLWAVCSSVFRN